MTGVPPERAAVLVIRVWTEGDPEAGGLRARITQTLDLSAPEKVETVAGSRQEVGRIVQDWLDAFLAVHEP
jgi:hypothetical protein